MNVTITRPGTMKVEPEYTVSGGRVMVCLSDEGNQSAGLLWVTPEVATQWIEALTPLAAQAKQ